MGEHRNRSSSTEEANPAIDNLNPEELAELREAFRVFDQDGDVSSAEVAFVSMCQCNL